MIYQPWERDRDFKPDWAAQKWLADLAIFLEMERGQEETLCAFKNRMYVEAKRKQGRK